MLDFFVRAPTAPITTSDKINPVIKIIKFIKMKSQIYKFCKFMYFNILRNFN